MEKKYTEHPKTQLLVAHLRNSYFQRGRQVLLLSDLKILEVRAWLLNLDLS